ncbi:MAG: PIN domain-containing protein [Desulfobacteraceae bacterium]|nr:MAG: PIN domain-containing protein [Desulfobacteraceae bacterium]
MIEKTFVDTNILVYAHDLDATGKRKIAQKTLSDLWENGTGTISIQVLHEFYVTVTRKIQNPISIATARGIIENYLTWPLIINDEKTMMHATEIEERYRLSFWDALILAAACRAKAEILLTEDLSHDQEIEGIQIVNPFL